MYTLGESTEYNINKTSRVEILQRPLTVLPTLLKR